MQSNTYKIGITFAVITTIISGFSIFLNKYAVSTITPAIYFTAVKNFGVALLVLGLIFGTKKLHKLKNLNRKELQLLLGISLIGGTLPFYLFFTGLTQTSAINAAILQKTLILWVALFAAVILKDRLTKSQFIGVALIFFSNFLVGGFKGISFSKGELMILASAFFWGIEYVIAKKALSTVDSDIVAFFRMSIGSVILLIATYFYFPNQQIKTDTNSLFWIATSVLLLFGYVSTWYKALKNASVLTVSSILTGSTIITNILSAIFVTKTFQGAVIYQSALLVLGMYLVIKKWNLVQNKMDVTTPNDL